MRSTGEVMGIDLTVGLAFAKSQIAAGTRLPESGTVFLSLADRDKAVGVAAPRSCSVDWASPWPPPAGTAGLPAGRRRRGGRPTWPSSASPTAHDAVDLIASGEVDLVVNSPRGRGPRPTAPTSAPRPASASVPLLTTGRRRPRRGRRHGRLGRHALQVRPCRSTSAASAPTSSSPVPTSRRCPTWHEHPRPPTAGSDRRVHPSISPRRSARSSCPTRCMTASGTAGHGAELARLRRPVAARRGGGEVALGRAVAGQPRPAGARDRRPG